MLRLVALVISISVLFPWLSSERRGRMRIFFLHWASGVMYVMSQFIMSVMVLNCWSSRDDSGPFIYFLKFLELTALNLWSISSLAIAILIASIVQSFVKLRRVPTMIGSTRAACVCLVLAILATVLSAVFWNGVLITGGYFWVTNTGNESHGRWISLSFGATQTVAGMLMALAVLFTVSGERFSSLKVCCKTSQRVKFHFILTIFGTFVYLYNGIVLMFDEFSDFKISKRLVIIGWCSRYVHVIADTGIIFGAFYALEKKEEEESLLRRESNSGGTGDCNGTSASKARLGVLRFGNDDNNISGNLEAGLGRGPTECMGGGGEVCPNGSRKNGSSVLFLFSPVGTHNMDYITKGWYPVG
ncbi:hypothetical protein Esi_0273_0019 [Ectocarpus siliculosus]|uniref:Uncharacterized protein n=1 Tax=Ectocarpus siliculosus TaxID=2880 RepID=D7FUL6_ECTSI|nr:hypothetical protein Esi_0273_0019 [Ectocarpus siliculosus]|eukprot:CBJ31672.1 hypothetical protein Esi_0273_0019 [Ectocarpus siliculosus]